MTMYDMPNQEVVRVNPPGLPVDGGDVGGGPAGYDPGAHTVAEVQEYVTAHPDERAAVLQAETAGKARSSLLEWLNT